MSQGMRFNAISARSARARALSLSSSDWRAHLALVITRGNKVFKELGLASSFYISFLYDPNPCAKITKGKSET